MGCADGVLTGDVVVSGVVLRYVPSPRNGSRPSSLESEAVGARHCERMRDHGLGSPSGAFCGEELAGWRRVASSGLSTLITIR